MPRSISERAATITTAASVVCGQVGEQAVEEQQEHDDDAGAHQPRDLALGARLLGHGRARAAGRHGEALEEPGGDVRGAHADHLLVGLDLVAAPGGEARRRGDGVGQGHERDAHRGDEQRPHVADGSSTGRPDVGTPCGSAPTVFTPCSASPSSGRRRRWLRRRPRAPPAPARVQSRQHRAGRGGRRHRRPASSRPVWSRPAKNALTSLDEPVGIGREAEQLGQLADEDRDGEAVHVADLDLLREQVGDEAELAEPQPDLDKADHEGHHPGQGDGRRGVAAGEQRHDGGEDQRRDGRVGPQDEDA